MNLWREHLSRFLVQFLIWLLAQVLRHENRPAETKTADDNSLGLCFQNFRLISLQPRAIFECSHFR